VTKQLKLLKQSNQKKISDQNDEIRKGVEILIEFEQIKQTKKELEKQIKEL
jgi:hypothetical protein